MKKVLVTGTANTNYPRNQVIIQTLREEAEVIVGSAENSSTPHLALLWQIFRYGNEIDCVLYLFPSHFVGWTALLWRVFCPRVQVIYDTFNSIEHSYVFDRELVSPFSLKHFFYFLLDWIKIRAGEVLLFDTREHQRYFEKFSQSHVQEKGVILPVCVDTEMLDNISADDCTLTFPDSYNVFFYGNYIPLQGVEYIIEAAQLLEHRDDIYFTLVGGGQTQAKARSVAKELEVSNVTFVGNKEYRIVLGCVKAADISLGIFGETEKAGMVVPNKVVESLGCESIVITGKNKPMQRNFRSDKDIFFCQRGDPHDLAETIERVAKLSDSRIDQVKKNARTAVQRHHSKSVLRKRLEKIIY